jgi:hypothetical protein
MEVLEAIKLIKNIIRGQDINDISLWIRPLNPNCFRFVCNVKNLCSTAVNVETKGFPHPTLFAVEFEKAIGIKLKGML